MSAQLLSSLHHLIYMKLVCSLYISFDKFAAYLLYLLASPQPNFLDLPPFLLLFQCTLFENPLLILDLDFSNPFLILLKV